MSAHKNKLESSKKMQKHEKEIRKFKIIFIESLIIPFTHKCVILSLKDISYRLSYVLSESLVNGGVCGRNETKLSIPPPTTRSE